MSFRFAKLNKEWLLRGWTDVPWAVVNWKNGGFYQLGKEGFYVARSCNGRTNFESAAFLPRHIAVLEKLIKKGIAEECRPGDPPERIQEYRKADNPIVLGIGWSITGLCNLNCRHCFMDAPSKRVGEFSWKEVMRLIEQFERANVTEVALTGGEPFMRNDLPEIIDILSDKRIRVAEVFSNGLLITDHYLNTFKRLGHGTAFKISFDGCGTHDYMRGTRGIEAKVIESIKRVCAAGFPVVVISSIDQVTRESLYKTYDLMKTLAISGWWLAPPVEIGNWRGSTTGISSEEMVETCGLILNRWLDDGRPINLKLWRFGHFRNPRSTEGNNKGCDPLPQYSPEDWNCSGTHFRPYLLPEGTLLPCSGYTDTSIMGAMPNLLKQDLTEVWTNSILRRLADIKKRDIQARNELCADCDLFKYCGAGCRVLALSLTSDLMNKDPTACVLFKEGHILRFREIAETGGRWDPQSTGKTYR